MGMSEMAKSEEAPNRACETMLHDAPHLPREL